MGVADFSLRLGVADFSLRLGVADFSLRQYKRNESENQS